MRNNTMNAISNPLANLVSALALGVAVVGVTSIVLLASPAVAADKDKDKKDEAKVSRELAKPLKAAQDAMNAKKYDDAIKNLKDAEANAKKTPYDEHVINQLAGVT